MTEKTNVTVATIAKRSPGDDDSDPYEGQDISKLPNWWSNAVEEFEAYDLRPYRPPRFADGTLKRGVVEILENKHNVSIRFIGHNTSYEDNWTVEVAGESVGSVGRHRSPNGYTVFEIDANTFIEWMTDAATDQ
jgi:hypothetical protein